MSRKYTLSICIPTYNREVFLKRLLESIVTQKWFTEEVCIVINDWPSRDDTTEMVGEYQKKYKNIFYSRNEVAVWMLPAILESIDMSNWQYTWLFGSDDFMQEDALENMLNLIRSHSPALLLSNRLNVHTTEEASLYRDKELHFLSFHGFSELSEYIGLPEESKYQDKWNYLTFMSVFCFNTEYYRQSKQYTEGAILDIEGLKKHYFNYIVILFSQLSSERWICIIESPRLVFCQSANTSWEPNHKINQDIKMLMNLLKRSYALTPGCIRIFRRMYLESFIYWTLLYNLQRIPVIDTIMKKLMQNSLVKKIYYSLTRILSWSRSST